MPCAVPGRGDAPQAGSAWQLGTCAARVYRLCRLSHEQGEKMTGSTKISNSPTAVEKKSEAMKLRPVLHLGGNPRRF